MTALLWGIAAAVFSAVIVAAYLPQARRRGWVDAPNHRSSHRRPTPNSAGVVVIPGFVVVTCLAVLIGAPGFDVLLSTGLAWLFIAVGIVCITGAFDDRRDLPAALRLTLFLAVSAVLVATIVVPRSLPALIVTGLLAVALAWLINLFNFMDGLDGLAALQSVLVAAMLAAVAHAAGAPGAYVSVATVLAGSFLGFLLFNWPPAKLFMGDSGSLSVGLVLGWLGLSGWHGGWVPVPVWGLLMSPFLIDTAWTLLRRVQRGAPLAQAHREHLYQRLSRRWRSHRSVVLALLMLHLLWLQPLVLLQLRFPAHALTILLLGLFPQLLLMVRLRRLQ